MPLSAFGDRKRPPTPAEIRKALGAAHASWTRLRDLVDESVGRCEERWGYTSATTGWGLRLVLDERVIAYMTPQQGQFLVSFALGERAVTAARGAKLPATLLEAIDAAPRYAEGRGVRLVVKAKGPLAGIARLARIKAES